MSKWEGEVPAPSPIQLRGGRMRVVTRSRHEVKKDFVLFFILFKGKDS